MPSESTSWDHVADWYDALLRENNDTFQKEVILPNLLRLMVIKTGNTILDLACGQGFFSAAFFHEGAHVIGIDIAEKLIERAKKNVPQVSGADTLRSVRFFVAPAHNVPMIAKETVQNITIILAVQNIENLKEVFAECHRILKPGGKIFIVMNHPAFRIPKQSGWEWDKNGNQYRRIDRYLLESKEKIQMHPGDQPDQFTVSFHRPMQLYFKLLVKNGFCVSNLEEWISHKKSDSGPRAPEENRARMEIPMFLFLEATKL